MNNWPLPVTVDRLFIGASSGAPWEDYYPGYAEISHEQIDIFNMIHIFTWEEGKAKQRIVVKGITPQVWYVTCVAPEATFPVYESTFDEIVVSFSFLS